MGIFELIVVLVLLLFLSPIIVAAVLTVHFVRRSRDGSEESHQHEVGNQRDGSA